MIIFIYSNIVGTSPIADDIVDTITDPILKNPYLPSVSYSDNFSVDVEVSVLYQNDLGDQILPATFVLINPIPGFKVERLSSNSIRLIGNRSTDFSDKYLFVDDMGQVNPGLSDSIGFKALVEYQMPTEMSKLAEQFLIVGTPPNPFLGGPALSSNVYLKQWAYWNISSAEDNIQRLVSGGV
jgi:hypothetical protein